MKYVISITLFLGLFITPLQTFALSCAEPPPIEKAFDNYEGIVIGTVVDNDSKRHQILHVEVDKSLKGINEENIQVIEDSTWGESVVGNTYLFFLDKTTQNGNWINPLCSPSTLYTEEVRGLPFFLDKDLPTIESIHEKVLQIELQKDSHKPIANEKEVNFFYKNASAFVSGTLALGMLIYGVTKAYGRREPKIVSKEKAKSDLTKKENHENK